jgi:hypothetical protein
MTLALLWIVVVYGAALDGKWVSETCENVLTVAEAVCVREVGTSVCAGM